MNKEQMGKRIQKLRQSRKMSLYELSVKVELTESYVGLMERGSRLPSLSLMVKISQIFNVSLDYLVFGKGDEND